MPSMITTLLRTQISLLNPLLNALDLSQQRRLQDALSALGNRAALRRVYVRRIPMGACQAAWVFPRKGRLLGAALYLHGGAYTAGSLDYAKGFGSSLALESRRATLCLDYRLAPEHPHPAALEDAVLAYRLMLRRYQPRDIALVGESAGGGLCLALALKIKELNLPLPGKILVLSPWVDLSFSLAKGSQIKDPILSCEGLARSAGQYLEGQDPSSPLASPLFGDLSGLPPTLIITGGEEILLPENQALHQKLLASGVSSQLHVEEGLWHVYPLYPVPEAKVAQELMVAFLQQGEQRP